MGSALRDSGSTHQWRQIRKRIIQRDQGICQACGGEGNSVDHIIPRHHGGGDEEFNLQLLCVSCNSSKGRRDITNEPIAPKGAFFYNATTPLTLSGFVLPLNDSKSHEND